MMVMDQYDLRADPCDNRIIACSNCLQLLSCFCHILAMFEPSFSELAQLLDCIADCAFFATLSCMLAQIDTELKKQGGGGRIHPGDGGPDAPDAQDDAKSNSAVLVVLPSFQQDRLAVKAVAVQDPMHRA